MDDQRKRVFISHSHGDNEFVERLAADCEVAGIRSWLDLWEIRVGDSLRRRVEQGIDSAAWLAVVLSKSSVASEWVQHELSMGFVKELESRKVFVLPLLIEDCQIPLSLRDKFYSDFRRDYALGLETLLIRLKGIDPQVAEQRRLLERYWGKCERQLPILCSLIVLPLDAGVGMRQSLETAAKDIPDPLKTEMLECLRELPQGAPLAQVFDSLVTRIPTYRCHFFAACIRYSLTIGTPVAAALKRWNFLRDIEEGDFLR